jgi:hypothetical protein
MKMNKFSRKWPWIALVIAGVGGILYISSHRFEIHDLDNKKAENTSSPTKADRLTKEEQAKRVAEFRQKAHSDFMKQVHEEQASGFDPHLPYTLFGDTGEITTAAAEAAKLTPDEKLKANSALRKVWNDASDQTLKRAVLNDHESDLQNNSVVYNISAAPDRGKALIEELKSEMSIAVGQEKGDTLVKAFDRHNMFGYFGMEDVKVKLNYSEANPEDQSVDMEYYNPESGQQTMRASMAMSELSRKFGIIFPAPEK